MFKSFHCVLPLMNRYCLQFCSQRLGSSCNSAHKSASTAGARSTTPSSSLHFLTVWNRDLDKKTLPVKNGELEHRIQKSGRRQQDYTIDIRRRAQEAYSSMDPEFVESAAVDSFVDGISDWEVQSLIRMRSCKNTTAALAMHWKLKQKEEHLVDLQ